MMIDAFVILDIMIMDLLRLASLAILVAGHAIVGVSMIVRLARNLITELLMKPKAPVHAIQDTGNHGILLNASLVTHPGKTIK